MSIRSTLARAGLSAIAAATVGSAALAAPVTTFVGRDVIGLVAGDQVQTDTTWSGGATRDLDDEGKWRATVTRGNDMDVLDGTYGTEREARRAGKAEAKARNKASGFMDGPGCQPPVLC